MLTNYVKTGNSWQGGPLAVMARVTAIDGATVLTVANVTGITRTIGYKSNGVWTAGTPVSLTVSSTISALSTSNNWTNDTIGYNFRDIVPGSSLNNIGETRISYSITTSDGNNVPFVVETNVKNPFSN